MKNIIIGTAGHIDHGKTTLIKALTGKDTDTSKEEKERGISINLGFTYFDLPSKRRAGIIDVPGHEKFVKNMLAGISGVDIVLMVIAADEGVMPQTREHFEILQLLNVKKGIIVLTKTDMVDSEWIEMIEEDLRSYFKGTFLENSPIHKVSSKTKEGIDLLIGDIDKLTEEISEKDVEGHFRLPVDRAFSVSGFGTVITGTIISGSVRVGDTVEIYPNNIKTKIRSIQIHGESKEVGEAGQRCALNLSNVKLSEVKRGDVISGEGLMESSMIIDCKLYYLKSMDKPLLNRQRVRLYHGTNEILCRVIILDREELNPGESTFVQLRLESELTSQRNDRFVIRNYSPMYTIGGGIIINPVSKKTKRFDKDYIEELKIKESGKTEGILESAIKKMSKDFPEITTLVKALGKNEQNIEGNIEELVSQGKVIKLTSVDNPIYIHKDYIESRKKDIINILKAYHLKNPLKIGMGKEEVKNKIFGIKLKQKAYDEILNILKEEKAVRFSENFLFLYDFDIKLSKEQEAIKNKIIYEYKKGEFNPPKISDIMNDEKDKKTFKMVYDMLVDNGALIKLSLDSILLKEYYDRGKDKIVKHIKEKGKLSTSEGREILNTNRKTAVSLLEHMDSLKITKRVENDRVLF
ncbi:selenocysteine-specific translation elongation factor [Hathewaya histolytica]|uniref:Selenocysteine-specific elongation factor n=1 Tax=Hathewaya histolytica TaxID=1498 RepID=A0A4U9RFY2_HATHI|nr:selenocysteine-specific translation elongation factor [Hathewaya histolytica]VTQ90754.1 selenocysteine-specific translation elongation factor [Hathewaya histolytica]